MKNDERDALPKRSASELSRDLRARAEMLTGEKFERTATIAMMREAADMIEQLAPAAHQERTEPKEQKDDDVSVQPRLDRSKGTDDRASAVFIGHREPAARDEEGDDVRVQELRREALSEHERINLGRIGVEVNERGHYVNSALVAHCMQCPQCQAAWEAAVGAPASAAEWQPMTSAPEDGTEILVCHGVYMSVVSWEPSFGGWLVCENIYVDTPTAWMPLPLPPCALTGNSNSKT